MRNVVVGLLVATTLAFAVARLGAARKYSYYRIGDAADVVAPTTAGTVLMGGGLDVDEAFQWMCARSGNGDFLVIRTTGTDAYNPYVGALCPGLNSVATLVVPSIASANDPFVVNAVRTAEAVWIAGGDQSTYVAYWKNTALQDELNAAIGRGVPVGGTSAGMMVLTPFIYSATGSQGVTSSQALADPFNKYITLDRDFAALEALQNVVGDSHFGTRDRMGRELAFMCRVAQNGWSFMPRGIAIDEGTALLVDRLNEAKAVGAGAAYFLAAPAPAEVCQPKTPLTYTGVEVYRITEGGTFDLSRWRGANGTDYQVSAHAGVLSSTLPDGAIY